MNTTDVIAVNEKDEVVGYVDKMEAHKKGVLHRAVSVFIFNSKGEWLLQQRAAHKYHSGLLWSNTTCTHPFMNESVNEAGERRLMEEMGLKAMLVKIFAFQYYSELENGLVENELDHVFIGKSDDFPKKNPDEVANFRYVSSTNLAQEINDYPELFTAWFKLLFKRVLTIINK